MPAAESHALLALNALLEELDALDDQQVDRLRGIDPDANSRLTAARADAMLRLAAADRLDLFDAAAQRLAAACVRRELPQPARAAAYSALVGLIASDLLPPATFRTLYDAWEAGLDGHGASPAIMRGEEVLLHIE
jgi:hypothetical protein